MKWRDAVKAAIMHGPLPPDVTLDAPYWWQPGMPLLPPADYMAPVPLKRKHNMSAEPKTDPTKRAYMRIPDEAKLWFVDVHAYQARVYGSSSGPWQPTRSADGMMAAHLTSAREPATTRPFASREPHTCRRGQAESQRPPFGSTSTAVCCASSTSNSSPADDGRGSFFRACRFHGSLRRLAPATGPSEADIVIERKLLQLRVIYLCDRFKISQDRIWNLDETAVRMVPAGERGWSKKGESTHSFASRAFVTVTLAANMRGGMWS